MIHQQTIPNGEAQRHPACLSATIDADAISPEAAEGAALFRLKS
jgi:hypothetical protein